MSGIHRGPALDYFWILGSLCPSELADSGGKALDEVSEILALVRLVERRDVSSDRVDFMMVSGDFEMFSQRRPTGCFEFDAPCICPNCGLV